MGRKKRRSSKFRDGSTVIDMEQARKDREERQKERQKKKQKMEAKNRTMRSRRTASRDTAWISEDSFYYDQEDPSAGGYAQAEDPAVEQEGRAAENGQPGASVESDLRQSKRRMALRKRKRNRTMIVGAVTLALLILVSFSLGNIIMLKHDLHVAKKEQEQYKEEKAQLEEDMQEINDLENLEEQARDQMRLIKPGETLYIFPEEMAPERPSAEEEDPDQKDQEQQEQKEE